MSAGEWKPYEKVAAELLGRFKEHFGLEKVEGKQHVHGNISDVDWEFDAKGIQDGTGAIVVIEARRYTTSAIKQEAIGAIAFRIIDTGAAGGICVSPLGFQEGAEKVAAAMNIAEVILTPESTTNDYVMQFLNTIFAGITERLIATDKAEATVVRNGTIVP